MDQAGLYLKKLVEEYLSTPEDRRQVWETLVGFMATGALIVAAAAVLWAL